MGEILRILITGAAGYIGSTLAERLKQHELILMDNYSAHIDGRLRIDKIDKHEILNADFTDENTCRELTQNIDIVYHLGAISGIARCENLQSYITNVIGTTLLGMWSEKNDVKKFIYASSSSVYGESQSENITELHRIKPRCRYGWQKYVSELILQTYKLPVVIFRKSNLYGHGLYHKRVATDIFIDKAMVGDDITIDGSGNQRRDYVHITDVVDAYTQAVYWDSGIYNIGGNDNLSVNELADLILTETKSKSKKIYNSKGDWRLLKKFIYNCDKARENGYDPKLRIADEIKTRFDHYSNQTA